MTQKATSNTPESPQTGEDFGQESRTETNNQPNQASRTPEGADQRSESSKEGSQESAQSGKSGTTE